jgi:hypothetical protein
MEKILQDGKGAGPEFEHATDSVHNLQFYDPVQGNCIQSSHQKAPSLLNCTDLLLFCRVQARFSVPMCFSTG